MRRSAKSAQRLLGAMAGAAVAAALAALLMEPLLASADTIVLKDGTRYEGRVIARAAEFVEFEVDKDGIQAKYRFETRDIASLTESPPESAQLAEQFQQRWLLAQEAGVTAAFVELGQWAQDNRLYEEAVRAYQFARQMAPDQDAALGFAAARNMVLANNRRSAFALLKELAEKHPDDTRIADELARLDQQDQRQVDQRVRQALDNYKKGEMRSAVDLLERVSRLNVEDVSTKVEYACVQQASMSFGRLLSDARLHQPCPTCAGEAQLGLVPCPNCRGSGKVTKTRPETVTKKDPRSGIEERRVYQVEYQSPCPMCQGFTVVLCSTCHGAGCDLGAVGPDEKLYVIDGLRKRIDFLYEKLAPWIADPSSLDPVNLEIAQLAGMRLRYFMQQYAPLNADLVGDELATFADRRTCVDNLLRHTTLAYRNRDLADYKEVLKARLKDRLRRDGILWPEDFEYSETSEVSANTTQPPGKR